MRLGIFAGIAIAVAALGALSASAQQAPDPPICNANLREWSRIATGADTAAMRDLLTRTPNACRELRGQMQARIAALAPRPRVEAPPPVDPCIASRSALRRIETSGTLEQVQAYLDSAPAGCAAERAAAQTRLAALQEAARPRLPDRYANELRGYVSAEGIEWLGQFNHSLAAQFRPHRLETRVRSESGYTNVGPRSRCNSLLLLPQGYRRGVAVSEYYWRSLRSIPILSDTLDSNSASHDCSTEDSHTQNIPASQQPMSILAFGAFMMAGPSPGYEWRVPIISGEVDFVGERAFVDMAWTQEYNGSTPKRVTCRETRRFDPGQWNSQFEFSIIEMRCQGRDGANDTSGTVFYVPELAMPVSFVAPVQSQSGSNTMTMTPANVQVVRDGTSVQITYRLTVAAGAMLMIQDTTIIVSFADQ